MKLHNSTKLVEAYKNIKQAIQKETRKAYWTYMENIICYDENLDVAQKPKTSGITLKTQERTTLEFHPSEKMAF